MNGEYFNTELLKLNGIYEVERVYHKLMEKGDALRNEKILVFVELKELVLQYKHDANINKKRKRA